jgi:hypothetical protein
MQYIDGPLATSLHLPPAILQLAWTEIPLIDQTTFNARLWTSRSSPASTRFCILRTAGRCSLAGLTFPQQHVQYKGLTHLANGEPPLTLLRGRSGGRPSPICVKEVRSHVDYRVFDKDRTHIANGAPPRTLIRGGSGWTSLRSASEQCLLMCTVPYCEHLTGTHIANRAPPRTSIRGGFLSAVFATCVKELYSHVNYRAFDRDAYRKQSAPGNLYTG